MSELARELTCPAATQTGDTKLIWIISRPPLFH